MPFVSFHFIFRCVHITDIGVGYISTMLSLSALFLRWCSQVRDFGLQHLCSMRNLQVLSLAGKSKRRRREGKKKTKLIEAVWMSAQLNMLMLLVYISPFSSQVVLCWPRAVSQASFSCVICRSWNWPTVKGRPTNCTSTCTSICRAAWLSNRRRHGGDNKVRSTCATRDDLQVWKGSGKLPGRVLVGFPFVGQGLCRTDNASVLVYFFLEK